MTVADSFSDHPVDQLIARIARGETEATPEDVDAIVQRMATAPFNRRPVRVRIADRGLTYQGTTLGALADSAAFHLAKRVQHEGQWAEGTTIAEYLADLQTAVRLPQARILVFQRAGPVIAATISSSINAVPIERLGPDWLPNLFVVYSARHGTLRTGYMFSSMSELNLPEAIRWLR